MGICSYHRVEDDEQLSHAGGDDDFERFAGFFKALSELADHGIPVFGGKGGHVERASDRSPATVPTNNPVLLC